MMQFMRNQTVASECHHQLNQKPKCSKISYLWISEYVPGAVSPSSKTNFPSLIFTQPVLVFVLDCWSDKASKLNMLSWPLGNCDGYFQYFLTF